MKYKSWKCWVVAVALMSLSIILTRLCGINIGETVRITLGRLPIMLASIWLGPIFGMIVGGAADLLGAMLSTGINPLLTIPELLCGLLPYVFYSGFGLYKTGGGKRKIKHAAGVLATVLLTKIITQGIIKTMVLAYLYEISAEGFFLFLGTRCAITVGEGVVETIFICLLLRNKVISGSIDRIKND